MMKKRYYIHPTVVFELVEMEATLHQLSKTDIDSGSANGGSSGGTTQGPPLGEDDEEWAAKEGSLDFSDDFAFQLDM